MAKGKPVCGEIRMRFQDFRKPQEFKWKRIHDDQCGMTNGATPLA